MFPWTATEWSKLDPSFCSEINWSVSEKGILSLRHYQKVLAILGIAEKSSYLQETDLA